MKNSVENKRRQAGSIANTLPGFGSAGLASDEDPTDRSVYRRLVQGITDFAIFMLDVNGIVTSWNAGAQRSKGYTAAEIIGEHFSRFYCPEDRCSGLPELNLQVARATGSHDTQGWRVRKDGGHFWAHVVIDAVYGDDGALCGFAKVTRDCTEDRKLLESTFERERGFRLLVQSVTGYAIYMLDAMGNISSWNAGARRMKGYALAEIMGRSFSCFYTPEDRAAGMPARGLDIARQTGRFDTEGWRVRKDGSRFWAHVVIHPIYDDAGVFYGFAKITQDCTAQRASVDALAETNRNLDLALANMLQGLCLFDRRARIVLCNERFAEILAIPVHVAIPGTRLNLLLAYLSASPVADTCPSAVRTRLLRQNLLKNHYAGGGLRTSEFHHAGRTLSIVTRALPDGGSICTVEDVTARRLADERIHYLAHHDELTGLRNRTSFQKCVERLLKQPASGQRFALLYLDLDRFKHVNDTLGHHVGDRVLRDVAKRLSDIVSEDNELARLGGDEFAIVMRSCDRAEDAQALANACIQQLSQPFNLAGDEIFIGVSIGIAWSATGGCAADTILREADVALYRAKWEGRGGYRVFYPGMIDPLKARRDMEDDLRRALRTGGLELHYQPIVDAATGETTACEALARWTCDHRGNVLPAEFIRLAEERGLMHELGAWVLHRACEDAVTWPVHIRLSVNVSPVQLRHHKIVDDLSNALKQSGLPPSRLELEMTETALLADSKSARQVLDAILSLGVGIAMDDFGTGYSSLSLLQDFPFSRIKIDRTFIRGLGKNSKSIAIVRHITSLCRTMGLPSVAEGVETDEQMRALVAEQCSELQGFLISRPLSTCDLMMWLKR